MSAQPLDIRMAALESSVEHLNGTNEQIDKRLGDLRADVIAGFALVGSRFGDVESRFESRLADLDWKIDGNFRALIGWMIAQTAVVVGAVVSVGLVLHC